MSKKTFRPSIIAQRTHSFLTGQTRETPMYRTEAMVQFETRASYGIGSRPGTTFGNRMITRDPVRVWTQSTLDEANRLRVAAFNAEKQSKREHDCGVAAVGGFCPHTV